MLTKKNLKVTEVDYGENSAKLIAIKVAGESMDKRDFVVSYVPPKTRSWNENDYAVKLRDTKSALSKILDRSAKIVLMGNFNCKEVRWEDWSTQGGESSWGSALLDVTMEHAMTQWIQQETRFESDEQLSRLDLVFMKEPNIVSEIKYKPPINKSDHILLEIELAESMDTERNKEHREGRLMYNKTDFVGLREFFRETNWDEFFKEETTVEDADRQA